jgi:hypothetical protein
MPENQSNASQLDLWLMYQNKALPYIRLRTVSDLSILSSPSFTRIIFVRHPLERLASAYVDKIASVKSETLSIYNSLRQAICRRFSSSYLTIAEQEVHRVRKTPLMHVNAQCGTIIPTFEHFVEYIMSDSSQLDVHWQPYSSLCHACTLKYNFIGKYETMQEDLQLLMSNLGLNTSDWNFNNNFSTGRTNHDYRSMYSQLPTRLICNLKQFYNDDFRLFDYRLEDYLIGQQPIHCPFQHNQPFRRLS